MDDKVKQHVDRLQEQLKLAEASLARVGQHLVSPELTPLADWKTLLQDATTRCKANREQAQQAGQRVTAWMQELEKKATVPFDDSNLDAEAAKADKQADEEDGLALDAILVAAYAIQRAEVGILNAFNTRKTAVDLARFGNVI